MSFAGSVPLVIDDALAGAADEDLVRSLLDKLERMSEAVQIIYLSDDPVVASWAEGVGHPAGRGGDAAPPVRLSRADRPRRSERAPARGCLPSGPRGTDNREAPWP